jgi:hypothetical protein
MEIVFYEKILIINRALINSIQFLPIDIIQADYPIRFQKFKNA